MQFPTPDLESIRIPPKPPNGLNSQNMKIIHELDKPTSNSSPLPTSPPSFKAKLLEQRDHIDINTDFSNHFPPFIVDQDQEMTIPSSEEGGGISPIMVHISPEDRLRIYEPWKFSLIIKLQDKRTFHHILKRKVQDLWKLHENFLLIDLGNDYFVVKLQNEDIMISILQNGQYFVFGYFLSIQRWQPNFVATEATQAHSAVWVRLP